ncbi:MAG: hypothetical protein ACREVL_13400 [Solimonas sp.]
MPYAILSGAALGADLPDELPPALWRLMAAAVWLLLPALALIIALLHLLAGRRRVESVIALLLVLPFVAIWIASLLPAPALDGYHIVSSHISFGELPAAAPAD